MTADVLFRQSLLKEVAIDLWGLGERATRPVNAMKARNNI